MTFHIPRLIAFGTSLLFMTPGYAAEPLHLVANFWEPFTGKTLNRYGCASEIVQTALKRAGYDSTVDFQPWARALRNTYTGRADGIVAIWRTEERAQKIDFSAPYYQNKMLLIKKKDRDLHISSLKDLRGMQTL